MNQLRTSVLLLLLAVLACAFYSMTHAQQAVSSPTTVTLQVKQASVHRSQNAVSVDVSGHILGPPTVSAPFIDRVLDVAQSPAKGIGTVMYQLGVRYGIDPAYALAFFHHESGYGKAGWAVPNRSIGNIRCTAGYACNGGYRSYPSYAASVADWYALLHDVYLARGLTTVQTIIPVYAPAADHNDEAAYIHSVLSDVASYRHGEVER